MDSKRKEEKKRDSFFNPRSDKVAPLLDAVIKGKPATLIELLKENSTLLFQKGDITDIGIEYRNVSPYQLMTFLCDAAMKEEVFASLYPKKTPPHVVAMRERQYSELGNGGADLIKLEVSPTELDFEQLCRRTFSNTTLGHIDSESKGKIDDLRYVGPEDPERPNTDDLTYPLLGNSDGIIFYQTKQGYEYYYINRKERSLERLYVKSGDHQEFSDLNRSMRKMLPYTSRRSSDREHKAIAEKLEFANKQTVKLFRQGIIYIRDKETYRDSCFDFNRLLNHYLMSSKLTEERDDTRKQLTNVQRKLGLGIAQTALKPQSKLNQSAQELKKEKQKIETTVTEELVEIAENNVLNFSQDFSRAQRELTWLTQLLGQDFSEYIIRSQIITIMGTKEYREVLPNDRRPSINSTYKEADSVDLSPNDLSNLVQFKKAKSSKSSFVSTELEDHKLNYELVLWLIQNQKEMTKILDHELASSGCLIDVNDGTPDGESDNETVRAESDNDDAADSTGDISDTGTAKDDSDNEDVSDSQKPPSP